VGKSPPCRPILHARRAAAGMAEAAGRA